MWRLIVDDLQLTTVMVIAEGVVASTVVSVSKHVIGSYLFLSKAFIFDISNASTACSTNHNPRNPDDNYVVWSPPGLLIFQAVSAKNW